MIYDCGVDLGFGTTPDRYYISKEKKEVVECAIVYYANNKKHFVPIEDLHLLEDDEKNHKNSNIKDERYPIGSKWMMNCDGVEIEVEVRKIVRRFKKTEMYVKSVSDNPRFKYYECEMDIEWYADKLFPIRREGCEGREPCGCK